MKAIVYSSHGVRGGHDDELLGRAAGAGVLGEIEPDAVAG
jgi:hypothetical protein